jgi:hypothetical protein
MDQNASDQGWQQLQANIEKFLGQSLQSNGRRLEYKPRFTASLTEGSTEHLRMDEALHHFRKSTDSMGKK